MKNVTGEQWYKKLRGSQVAGRERKKKKANALSYGTMTWCCRVQEYKQSGERQGNVTEARSSMSFLNEGLDKTSSCKILAHATSQNLIYLESVYSSSFYSSLSFILLCRVLWANWTFHLPTLQFLIAHTSLRLVWIQTSPAHIADLITDPLK